MVAQNASVRDPVMSQGASVGARTISGYHLTHPDGLLDPTCCISGYHLMHPDSLLDPSLMHSWLPPHIELITGSLSDAFMATIVTAEC